MSHHPPFSLVMPYHNNPSMLERHYTRIAGLPPEIKRAFELNVCDDASDEPATYPEYAEEVGVDVNIYRIPPPHVPWSHRVATNIAAHHAKGAWFIVTDIDHVVPLRTWKWLTDHPPLKTNAVYRFARINADGSEYKPHPDSWLMHCSMWYQIGGYDTRYRGYYGQNMPFIERVECYAKIEQLGAPLVRYSRDDIPDASERVLERKSTRARTMIAELRQRFKANNTFLERSPLAPHERVEP